MSTTVGPSSSKFRGRLRIVFAISLAVMVAEVVVGLTSGSLALLADAGHMVADVGGIGLALLAIHFAARPPSPGRTFGWYRLEILAAVANAVLLLAIAVAVLIEAWSRFVDPPTVSGGPMLAVAVIGLGANSVSAWLLFHGQRESLNVRGAYLEVLGDLLGSLAVIAAAIAILATGDLRADAVASAAIGVLILPRTWQLLREAVDILLEATPRNVDLDEVRGHILDMTGVADVHDLHAWTITSGMNVVSAHVVLKEGAEPTSVLDQLDKCLSCDFDIEHSTFQLETEDRSTREEAAHR